MFTWVLGRKAASTVLSVPEPFGGRCIVPNMLLASEDIKQKQNERTNEGADRVAGQLRGDKESPFSGVTKSGRVWRKVPESDARSVRTYQTWKNTSD